MANLKRGLRPVTKASTVLSVSEEDTKAAELSRQNDAVILELNRQLFAEGDRKELLPALRLCLDCGYSVPAWLRTALIQGIGRVESGRVKSWDDIFGLAKVIAGRGRKVRIAIKVLEELVASEGKSRRGKRIANKFTDIIGPKLGVSGGTAKRFYYEIVGAWHKRPRSQQ